MSQSLSIWLKDILPRTPGVVRAVAKRELILAAREFYRDSAAWREVTDNFYFDVGDYTYTAVSSDASAEVMLITGVEANGSPLTKKAERPTGERTTGTPLYWIPTGGGTFQLWPTPDMYEDEVVVRTILIPAATTSTLPDIAYTLHYDALLDGVLGRLYAHPAKPYSNPTLGQYHLTRFRNAIGAAAGMTKQGGAPGQNWSFPPFAK